MTAQPLFIGLMSGTSLDGIDGVLVEFAPPGSGLRMLTSNYAAFPAGLRAELLALQRPGENEIEREALAANQLAMRYAECVRQLLHRAQLPASAIRAIGCHGQTIRHCPHLGYTRQANNPALLAELTGIDVIADFRSRDVAAGGQGAPLAPAFHRAVFAVSGSVRVVANIGGMTNIGVLDGRENGTVIGFDAGPGNVLMDAWCARHLGQPYDAGGAWAASGNVLPDLLDKLRSEPFFALKPPKSTGRDLFDSNWLAAHLSSFGSAAPADVQASLSALTAHTLADAIAEYAPGVDAVYVCGGGACNTELMRRLQQALDGHKLGAKLSSTDILGIAPQHVEALAFAWLAQRFDSRLPGNLPEVTGASGERILGASYPAK